jgi:hypothetical protein
LKAASEIQLWPNPQQLQKWDPSRTQLIVQASGATSPISENLQDFFCGNGDGIMGGVLIGTRKTIYSLAQDFDDFIEHELLPKLLLANDQMILRILQHRNSSRMVLIPSRCPTFGCKSGPNSAYPIFDWLAL